jgi:hexosaminidase
MFPKMRATPKIRGVQGQAWSETIRTDKQYFKMAFPQVLSVAERAWHKAGWELDWQAGVTYDNTTLTMLTRMHCFRITVNLSLLWGVRK